MFNLKQMTIMVDKLLTEIQCHSNTRSSINLTFWDVIPSAMNTVKLIQENHDSQLSSCKINFPVYFLMMITMNPVLVQTKSKNGIQIWTILCISNIFQLNYALDTNHDLGAEDSSHIVLPLTDNHLNLQFSPQSCVVNTWTEFLKK